MVSDIKTIFPHQSACNVESLALKGNVSGPALKACNESIGVKSAVLNTIKELHIRRNAALRAELFDRGLVFLIGDNPQIMIAG
jgi:hypothetical protein